MEMVFMASRLEVVSHNVKKIGSTDFVIVQDQKTGVLYAYGERRNQEAGITLTPLIDRDGKPVVEAPDHDEY